MRALLIGDGRNLGKSRQRKWQRALLQLKVIKEIPGTNPQLYEAGSAIGRSAELTPYRGDFADGSKVVDEFGKIIVVKGKERPSQPAESAKDDARRGQHERDGGRGNVATTARSTETPKGQQVTFSDVTRGSSRSAGDAAAKRREELWQKALDVAVRSRDLGFTSIFRCVNIEDDAESLDFHF